MLCGGIKGAEEEERKKGGLAKRVKKGEKKWRSIERWELAGWEGGSRAVKQQLKAES